MSVLQIYADLNSGGGGGGGSDTGTKYLSYTENGTYTEDVTGYAETEITIDVPSELPTGTKYVSYEDNGTYNIDVSNYANAEIEVNVQSTRPSGTINITRNGSYNVSDYATANVNVNTMGLIIDVNTLFNFPEFVNNNIEFATNAQGVLK